MLLVALLRRYKRYVSLVRGPVLGLLFVSAIASCGRIGFDTGAAGASDAGPGEDQCPDDPAKTAPGACGCGQSDDDESGSGLPDCLDPPEHCLDLSEDLCEDAPEGCPALFECASFDVDPSAQPAAMGIHTVGGTGGSYYDAEGVVRFVGPGETRYDYDLGTGQLNGVLTERASTNHIPDSSNMHTWNATEMVATRSSELGPDRATLSTQLAPTTANALHYVSSQFDASTDDGWVTFSVFVKPLHTRYGFYSYILEDNAMLWQETVWDLAPQEDGLTDFKMSYMGWAGDQIGGALDVVADGWYRYLVSVDSNAGGAVEVRFGVASLATTAVGGAAEFTQTVAGDAEPAFLIWGAQLEEGQTGTMYIPTDGAPASRGAGALAYRPPAAMEGAYSFLIEAERAGGSAATTVFRTVSSTEGNHSTTLVQTGEAIDVAITDAPLVSNGSEVTPQEPYRAIVTAAPSGWRIFVNGENVPLSPEVTRDGSVDTFLLGSDLASEETLTIRRLAGWYLPLPDAVAEDASER